MQLMQNIFLSLSIFAATACTVNTAPPMSGPAPTPATPSAPAAPVPDNAAALAPYMGLYSGDWGTMVLRQVGDEIWGAYTHDNGTVRGKAVGNVFTGRWCEEPSRAGDQDAGNVTFTFLVNAEGKPAIDGTWSYGTVAPDKTDWDITLQAGQADAALEARFADASKFCQ